MELDTILYSAAIVVSSFIMIKTYAAVEVAKQERISEEREKKAQIYAQKDIQIARTECSVLNDGFGVPPESGDLFSQLAPLLNNPQAAELIQNLLTPKK